MSATILAIANQKGGVGKTTTTANLGIGLARTGKRVLLIDADPQASLTISLGYANPDDLPVALTMLLQVTAQVGAPRPGEGILYHAEGVDLLPSNIELCSMEMTLINVLSRETTMKRLLEPMKKQYDYILIDCMPSLGQSTINALAAADSVIISVQAQYLSLKGLEQLYDTCRKIRTQINPNLKIEGILSTMVDNRTNYAREVTAKLRENYGSGMKVFQTEIPTLSEQRKQARKVRVSLHTTHRAKLQQPMSSLRGRCWRLKSSAQKMQLASLDDLFSTQASRDEAQREKVQEIPLEELHPFAHHPFKVLDDDRMKGTADSIREYGVLVPAIARPRPDGGYELIAGHRRKRGCELAGLQTMPVIVRELDDDAATIIMVDSVRP